MLSDPKDQNDPNTPNDPDDMFAPDASYGISSPNNMLARLRGGKTTKSQRKLLRFFDSVDPKRVIYMSITDLAAASGVAEATVLRFCRSLGFNGYQEFRLNLAQGAIDMGTREEEHINYVEEVGDAYWAAIDGCRKIMREERLSAARDLIFDADSVCCFGVGSSFLAARELHNRLMTMGILTFCEQDPHLQNVLLSSRGPKDLLILFSLSGCSKDTVEAAELAIAGGMKVMAITSFEHSPLARYADLLLTTAPIIQNSLIGSMTGKIMQLFMVDALCMGIHRSDKAHYDGAIARSRRATMGKLL